MNLPIGDPVRILILEVDSETSFLISTLLPKEYRQTCVTTVEEAEAILDEGLPDLFICADDLPVESGLMFLARTREKWPQLRRLLMMPDPDGDLYFHALREVPRLSYLSKPIEKRAFHRAVRHALWEDRAPRGEFPSLASSSNEDARFAPPGELPAQTEAPAIASTDVVILEADAQAASRLISLLPWGFRHHIATTVEEAEALLDALTIDLLLCSDDLPLESGLMFLARTRDRWIATRRILLVNDPDAEFFFHASRELPRLLYLAKPVKKSDLLHVLRHGLHDVFTDPDDDDPAADNGAPAISSGLIRVFFGFLILIIAACFVFGVMVIIYQLKCWFGPDLFSGSNPLSEILPH